MDMLQWIQELPAAQVIVGLLVLPWIGVALTHAFSAASRSRPDDAWQARADAALRWADTRVDVPTPIAPAPDVTVLQPRPRRAAQATSWSRGSGELNAA